MLIVEAQYLTIFHPLPDYLAILMWQCYIHYLTKLHPLPDHIAAHT